MPDHPRPDFLRPGLNWESLDGPWDFIFDDTDRGLDQRWQREGLPAKADSNAKRQIQVPYAFQTPASGIGVHEAHEVVWYERTVKDIRTAEERARDNRLVLRFNAVDYECTVWLDGQVVGAHRGGHVPFDLDLTDTLAPSTGDSNDTTTHRLTIRVRDSPYDLGQPRGKQFWGPIPESIFYTPTTGIWLSVWLESLPKVRLGSSSDGTVLRSNEIREGILHTQVAVLNRPAGSAYSVKIESMLGGVLVSHTKKDLPHRNNFVDIDVDMHVPATDNTLREKYSLNDEGTSRDNIALWAPDHPILYDVTLSLYNSTGNTVDTVLTTTGMRNISWDNGDGTFRVNGIPYFQILTLDQGYWPETGLTPPSHDALKHDIELSKNMGINGCRKHQKVEDPAFAYWADRLGFFVWGEIANAYEFSHDYISRYNSEWVEAVKRDINHPSVMAWTPFNESWAYPSLKDNIEQRNHIRSVYHLTKCVPSLFHDL